MKKLLLAVFSIATTFSLYAQREVPQERMEQIYEEVIPVLMSRKKT